MSVLEQNNETTEITYPSDVPTPEDVADIIDKLNIGTLRREKLRVRLESIYFNKSKCFWRGHFLDLVLLVLQQFFYYSIFKLMLYKRACF